MKKSHTVSLEEEDWQFVDHLVKKGSYDSRSAAIRAFIREAKRRKVLEVPLT